MLPTRMTSGSSKSLEANSWISFLTPIPPTENVTTFLATLEFIPKNPLCSSGIPSFRVNCGLQSSYFPILPYITELVLVFLGDAKGYTRGFWDMIYKSMHSNFSDIYIGSSTKNVPFLLQNILL